MAKFTSYGATITLPDHYAEGHTLTAKEATALNSLRGEFISHRVRASVFGDLGKGDTASPELAAAAQAKAEEIDATFEFGMVRQGGGGEARDPVMTEARAMARRQVMAALAKAKDRYPNGLSKKGEPVGEGEYPYETFAAKVEELAQHPDNQKAAKQVVKLKQGGNAGEGVEV